MQNSEKNTEKTSFRIKDIIKGHFIIEEPVHLADIKIKYHAHSFEIEEPKTNRTKGEIGKSTIIFGDFNTFLIN